MAVGGLAFRSLQQPVRTSTPAVNEYQGRGGSVNIGRIGSAFQAGQVYSGLSSGPGGGGLGALAKGFSDLSAVLEQQEEERQKLEAIEAVSAAQDEERAMFEQMSQMTGSAAAAAPQFSENFYQDLEGRLMKKARGSYQEGIFASTLAGMRDQGLNKALNHRISEHEAYKGRLYEGLQAQADQQIMSDPVNSQQYSAQKQANLRSFNPGAPVEWLAAQGDAIASADDLLAYQSALASGNFDMAQEIMQRSFASMPTSSAGGSRVQGARFALPTDNHHYVTSAFGPRKAPVTSKGMGTSDHKGIDLRMPVGTPVKAVSGGTISFAGDKGGYGTAVVIKHDDGSTTSQYGHLSQLNVQPGVRVNAGDVIALSGNTGKSTGPHLDLKITENGNYIDPASVLGLTGNGLSGPLENAASAGAAKNQPVMLAALGALSPGMGSQTDDGDTVDAGFVEDSPSAYSSSGEAALIAAMPSGYGGRMPPKQLFQMQNMWNKAVNAQAKQIEAERKRIGNEAQKDLTIKWYGSELNQADVMAARDLLSPDDFDKYMSRAMNGTPAPASSDRDTVLRLRTMAVNRDSGFQDELEDAFKTMKITQSDYESYATHGEKYKQPVLKQAEQIIKLKTGRSEMNPNPVADISYLQAMEDFDSWMDSDVGQKASDRERLEMANRIGDNYRMVSLENNLLAVPAPLFLAGSRTAPDIQGTLAATAKAREQGRLTEEQYRDELIRIKAFADILETHAATEQENQSRRSNR